MLLRTALLLIMWTPNAQAGDVTEVTAPEKGSPQEAVRESLIMMKNQKGEEWLTTWCTPSACETETQKVDKRRFMLKQAQLTSKNCLYGEQDALHVKEIKGNPETDDKLAISLECSHTRFPPPAVVEKVEGKWYVTSIPW